MFAENGHPDVIVVGASAGVVNRRGRAVTVRVICTTLGGSQDSAPRGAVIVMEPQEIDQPAETRR